MDKKKNRIRVINPIAEIIVKAALKLVFKIMLNVKPNMPEEVRNLKPPFVLLPNHQGFWDPFIAGVYFNSPVYYITSDAVFRSPLFSFLLKFLGAIPKTKAQSDLDALKNIFEIKDQGRNIGIFPEGQRNWDGETQPLIKSTSKLIRMLKIPVVTVVFKGGFYSHPRWGTSIRKGEVVVEYKMLFNGDEVGGMQVSEIHDRLTEALSYDETEYQQQKKIEFHGGRYAENIEQFLFACPACGYLGGFRSERDKFRCRSCERVWKISNLQVIKAEEGESRFDNIRDWNSWQLEQLHEMIDINYGSGKTLIEDGGLTFHTGFKSAKPRLLSEGSMRLDSDEIILFSRRGEELRRIPLRSITGINVQNREVLDLYYDNVLYTVRDRKKRFNAYKWWKAVDYLQRVKLEMNLPD